MNTTLNSVLLSSAVALVFAAAPAGAAPETVFNFSVAPAHCQAFTPGVQNTIRNRVSGAENVGASPISLACSFENVGTFDGTVNVSVGARLYNNSGAANMVINCTNLNGYFGNVGSTINKTTTIAAIGGTGTVSFSAADTADPADTDLGSFYSGINCTMPTGAIMTTTSATWMDDYA